MRLFHHIPPVAFPVEAKDFWAGVAGIFHPSKTANNFGAALSKQLGERKVYLVNSGRTALTLALIAAKKHGQSNNVIIPAYSCSTVLQSVLAAGLTPTFIDLSSRTFDYEQEVLFEHIKQQPLAVIGVHLFGLAQDYSEAARMCREHGVVLIEDCAQALGAGVGGQPVGSQGEMSIFSLGRGKNLPIGGGGVLAAGENFVDGLGELIPQRVGGREAAGIGHLIKLLVYQLLVNPFSWWWVDRSPLNPAGAGSDFSRLPGIAFRRLSGGGAGIGLSMLERSDVVFKRWQTKAADLMAVLRDIPFVRLPQVGEACQPVFLRLPLMLDTPGRTERLFNRLRKAGIGASRSYRFTLPDIYTGSFASRQDQFPGAAALTGRLITLPTNHFLDQRSVEIIASIFREEQECQ